MKTLLLGLGNPILSDDAIGIRLTRDVAESLAGVEGLDIVPDCTAGGLDLLPVLAGYERVILLDSIRTVGGVPGTCHHFTAARLRETVHLAGIHDANLATSLALGRSMGLSLADDQNIHIFAVEVEDNATFGESLTPALARAYPSVLEELLAAIQRIL